MFYWEMAKNKAEILAMEPYVFKVDLRANRGWMP